MVLLCLFIGNDFEEGKRLPRFQSYLVSFVRYLLTAKQHWNGAVIHGKSEYHDDRPSMSEDKYLEIETERSHIFRRNDPTFARLFPNTIAYLQQIRDLCRQKNIHILIVVMPDELQVNRDLQRRVIQRLNTFPPEEWDFTFPNRLLASELRRLGIPYIDLLQPFQATSETMTLYKPQDSHWNIAGNKIAAGILAEQVSSILDH